MINVDSMIPAKTCGSHKKQYHLFKHMYHNAIILPKKKKSNDFHFFHINLIIILIYITMS